MKKTLKIFAIIAITMVMISTSAQIAFAAPVDTTGLIGDIDNNISGNTGAANNLVKIAGRVVGLIQIASAVLAVILVAVFGFKFILGSANEKADYQKSFIPLIVGVVVVFAATSIANLIFGLMGAQ